MSPSSDQLPAVRFVFACAHEKDGDAREEDGQIHCQICGAEIRRERVPRAPR